MKTKLIGISLVFALVASVWYVRTQSVPPPPAAGVNSPAATIVAAPAASASNTQVFEVTVKEGYQPREIAAKAGVPMVLKMKTSSSFDCSTSFNIPKLGIHLRLQPTGEADIEIPAQKAGDTVYGVCSMGMYSLVIKFS